MRSTAARVQKPGASEFGSKPELSPCAFRRSAGDLAIGSAIVILAGFLFIHILRGVLHNATLAEADLRLRNAVHRPLPPDAIPLHLGPSFPSGHTLACAMRTATGS
jgi:membrane-associated phospholipid phosphatase